MPPQGLSKATFGPQRLNSPTEAGAAVPTEVIVDIPRLASLRSSALLVELLTALPHFTAADFRAFGETWVVITGEDDYYDVEAANWTLITRHWAERDPAGLEAWLTVQLGMEKRRHGEEMHAAFDAWARRHPDAAMAWAAAQGDATISVWARYAPGVSAEQKVRNGVAMSNDEFTEAAKRDPAALAASLDKYSEQMDFASMWSPVQVLAKAWAAQNKAAALAWALTLPADKQAMAIGAIAEQLEVQGIMALRMTRPAGEQYSLGYLAVQRLRQTDPWAALQLAGECFRGRQLETVALRALEDAANQDPERAKALFRTLGWPGGSESLLRAWADTAPAEALNEVGQAGWTSLGNTMSFKLGEWAQKDYAAALAWAQQAPEHLRAQSLETVVGSLVHKSPQEIQSYIDAQPPGPVKAEAVSALVSRLATNKDYTGVAEAIGAAPEEVKAKLLATYYPVLRHNEHAAALEEVIRTAPVTDESREKLTLMLSGMGDARSAALLASLPDGAVRPQAWENVTKEWSRRSPVEAGDWVAALPPGDGRDHAISGLVTGILADSDAPAAWEWGATISAPEQRLQTLARVHAAWSAEDPATAEAAILGEARLTEEEKQSILTKSP